MIQRKSTFFIGIFLTLLSSSFLGIPSSWKAFLLFVFGLALIVLSVKITLPKKNTKHRVKREKVTPVVLENLSTREQNNSPVNTTVDTALPENNTE